MSGSVPIYPARLYRTLYSPLYRPLLWITFAGNFVGPGRAGVGGSCLTLLLKEPYRSGTNGKADPYSVSRRSLPRDGPRQSGMSGNPGWPVYRTVRHQDQSLFVFPPLFQTRRVRRPPRIREPKRYRDNLNKVERAGEKQKGVGGGGLAIDKQAIPGGIKLIHTHHPNALRISRRCPGQHKSVLFRA